MSCISDVIYDFAFTVCEELAGKYISIMREQDIQAHCVHSSALPTLCCYARIACWYVHHMSPALPTFSLSELLRHKQKGERE